MFKQDKIKVLEEKIAKKEEENLQEYEKLKRMRKLLKDKKEAEQLPPPPEPEPNEPPLKKKVLLSRIKDLEEHAQPKIKKKEFKLPFSVRGGAKRASKKGQALILNLNNNSGAKFELQTITDEMYFTKDGNPHSAGIGYVFQLNGKIPLIVQPQWQIKPISTKEYAEAQDGNEDVVAAKTIIKMVQQAKIEGEKKKLSGKALIGLLVGAIVVGYILFSNGAAGGGQ